jgi:hypothetical protein
MLPGVCLQLPGCKVVGAALEGPKSFRVWYFTPTKPITHSSSSSSSSAPYPKFKLRKSLPFACDSGSEATALVQCVRQAAAWQGRQAPPRVLAVINPMSGQGRYARLDATVHFVTLCYSPTAEQWGNHM